jgi:tetratricopeptide (TPR) repeat protein
MGATISSPKQNQNLETYSLIWLDNLVNSLEENIQAQQKLRTSINHLLAFENHQACLEYIHSLPKDDRIVLIVSGKLGRIIVSQIVHLRQIISIYVYCQDKQKNTQWAQYFSKVKGVFVQLDELIHQIQADQTQQQHHKIDEPLTISIFNSHMQGEEQSSTELNGQFIHSQLLIDCLLRMKSSPQERQEFIDLCAQQYKNNPVALQVLNEFESDYSSNRSLWWYTRQSFLYRLLNKALRVQNIDLLYLFQFFIRDLAQELENNICLSPICIYRGQQMFKEEIEMLQKSVGEYISMNSFLSTSLNRQKARSFLFSAVPSDGVEKVFFEIDADPRIENTKPFSNITSLSYFPREEEVLFMIGSIFRLIEMKRDDDGIWNIRMILCSENGHQLQSLFQHMRNDLGSGATDSLQFGHVLRRMGRLDDAENYYHRYLNQLSVNDPNLSCCYHALGMVTGARGDDDACLKWYKKSLEIKMRTLESDHPNIAKSHNNIANLHHRKGDYTRALKSYERALMIFKKAYDENHPDVLSCLSNIGCVYHKEKKYSKALEFYQKVLTIRQKYLPANHSVLGDSHSNIGSIYVCLNHCDDALEHYNLSLKIKSKSLPPQHLDIAKALRNIAVAYEIKGDFQQTLSYLHQAAKIYRHSLPPTHPRVLQIEKNIKCVSSKMK